MGLLPGNFHFPVHLSVSKDSLILFEAKLMAGILGSSSVFQPTLWSCALHSEMGANGSEHWSPNQ